MTSDEDFDALMSAYCEGLYAMDPRSTYPFWDYDLSPLFSAAWMDKMLVATAKFKDVDPTAYPRLFGGPSVPRKELIYSLVDMKVARVPREERFRQVCFWTDLLKAWCGEDWLSNGSNRVPALDGVETVLAAANWVTTGRADGLAVGRMVVALNALAYGLYSDVFVHQCAESRGPYDVPVTTAEDTGRPHRLLVRTWSGLRPYRLHANCQDPGFDRIAIAAVYDSCPFSIDVYNHVSWAQSPVQHMTRYAVWLDSCPAVVSPGELSALAQRIGQLAETTFRRYQALGFEQKKRLWVRQRNYQFREFFRLVGLPEDAPEMEAAVRGQPLRRSVIWNTTLPKKQIFGVWKQCLDPRNEIYEADWAVVFRQIFDRHPRP